MKVRYIKKCILTPQREPWKTTEILHGMSGVHVDLQGHNFHKHEYQTVLFKKITVLFQLK